MIVFELATSSYIVLLLLDKHVWVCRLCVIFLFCVHSLLRAHVE